MTAINGSPFYIAGFGQPPLHVGVPESPSEIEYFQTMLRKTAPGITMAELETIRAYFVKHKP